MKKFLLKWMVRCSAPLSLLFIGSALGGCASGSGTKADKQPAARSPFAAGEPSIVSRPDPGLTYGFPARPQPPVENTVDLERWRE